MGKQWRLWGGLQGAVGMAASVGSFSLVHFCCLNILQT